MEIPYTTKKTKEGYIARCPMIPVIHVYSESLDDLEERLVEAAELYYKFSPEKFAFKTVKINV